MNDGSRSSPDPAAFAPSLEAALAEASAGDSVRRIARALQRAARARGLDELAAAAERVADADAADLPGLATALLERVRASPGEEPSARILLVEDSRTIAALVRGVLAEPGRIVDVAPTAAAAEEILREHPVDLLILDLILPDRDGRDLLVQLRESDAWAGLPVIVLSAMDGRAAQAECALLGADEFVVKPAEPGALRAAVTRQLARARRPTARRDVPTIDPVPPSPSPTPAPPDGVVRVAVVEDDRVTATLLRHRLEREGFLVTLFADGAEALDGIRAGGFHLVLLDVKVPGMDGFELLGRLRAEPSVARVPIMMLTSMGSEADVVRGLDSGADDYVLKPFSPGELVARVRRLLGGAPPT